MPQFPLALRDPDETLTIVLSKAPTRGTWFEVSGMMVRVEDIRHVVGSELVIFGVRIDADERSSLNPKKRRDASSSTDAFG
jgi:hypothetical protein